MNTSLNEVVIRPSGSLQLLSNYETQQLCDVSLSGLNDLLRRCVLAVLNTGSDQDNGLELLRRYHDFNIQVSVKGRGVQIIMKNPPRHAFVDDEMITGIREHVFAVIRDLLYARNEILDSGTFDLEDSKGITNAIFHIARNAGLMHINTTPNIIVCWGGHSINEVEYNYSKHLGYELGLRNLDVCTGCGPGIMKGPMKGAMLGHAKQRYQNPRYVGITEPGIIAAEAPNAFVNELCIMPDIEKRLEAFVRLGHGIVIFPGGPGTMEELLYLLSIKLNPANKHIALPVILTGPNSSHAYWDAILEFIFNTLGTAACEALEVIIEHSRDVASKMRQYMEHVRLDRRATSDAYYFNWRLVLTPDQQTPFNPTHESMSSLNLHKNQPVHLLASELRKAFSGIVAGNVKAEGVEQIEAHGPFIINGDREILHEMDRLLQMLVEQKRMKLDAHDYRPCYKIASEN